MKISVVMPVHNEEKYLPYSLKPLKECPIDEMIFILDRCTDRSKEMIESITFPFKVKIIEKQFQNWNCPTAEVFEIGFKESSGDWIHVHAGDLIYPPSMFDQKYYDLGYDMLMYFYYSLDLTRFKIRQQFLNLCKRYLTVPSKKRSGVFSCKRTLWDKIHFRDVPSEYDDFYKRALMIGAKVGFIVPEDKIQHLRVGLTKDRQYLQGMSRAHSNRNPVPVLLHSMLFLKPWVFVAYYQEKTHGIYKKKKWGKEGY